MPPWAWLQLVAASLARPNDRVHDAATARSRRYSCSTQRSSCGSCRRVGRQLPVTCRLSRRTSRSELIRIFARALRIPSASCGNHGEGVARLLSSRGHRASACQSASCGSAMYPSPDTPVQGLGFPDGPDPRDGRRLYSHPKTKKTKKHIFATKSTSLTSPTSPTSLHRQLSAVAKALPGAAVWLPRPKCRP